MSIQTTATPRIAVLVPCYNEALTIAKVIADFKAALPAATVYVFDNNSRDDTAAIATANGAQVHQVHLQGKGHVVRRLFADIEADVYVLVDGDDTYHAASAGKLIDLVLQQTCDMVVALRKATNAGAYRSGHAFGNKLLTGFLSQLFGVACSDILSGYRAFSRRYVKSFPVLSKGFEIETEFTVHALQLHMRIGEVETPYGERPEGSLSKLSTYKDGWRILMTMLRLFSAERPLICYSLVAFVLAVVSVLFGTSVIIEFLETGLVPRLPTALLSTGLMLLAAISLIAGLILDTVTRGRRELRMLAYLQYRSPRN